MTAWKPLVACLLVAPCALAQQSPLPAEGVIFDDFEYESTEWCREITGECDNNNPAGYPPEGSVFGRNLWYTSENGDTEYKRAWYRFSWRDQEPNPYGPQSLHAIPAPHRNGWLRFRAEPFNYPVGISANAISSGFTARRGVWAARVNFGDLEPPERGAMIQAFWLMSSALSLDGQGNKSANEIDLEWNNHFQGPEQEHHYLAPAFHNADAFRPGFGVPIPLFSPQWPDGDGASPFVGTWSCKFLWGSNGNWDEVAKIWGNKCTRIIKNQSIWINGNQYTPNYNPWMYLFIRITDNRVLFRVSSHGWGGTIVANTEFDNRVPNLPLTTRFSQNAGTNNNPLDLFETEDFDVDWMYYSPDTTQMQIGDVFEQVAYIKDELNVTRLNATGIELERPYAHMPGTELVNADTWGRPERTGPLSLDLSNIPSMMAPGEKTTLVALPPLRLGFFDFTWRCHVLPQSKQEGVETQFESREDLPGPELCQVHRKPGSWEASFTFPTDPTVSAVTIEVTLKERVSPDNPLIIDTCDEDTDICIHPITHSRTIFRDNSLAPDVESATAHQTGDGDGVPTEFSLGQNVPNAFASQTEIPFALPEARHVSLAVYDVLGREVARLVEGELEAGYHRAAFDASGLPAGVYVYRLEAEAFVESRRMMVAK